MLEKAIDQLPEKYKIVYILKEIEGMDHRAIASCLNISESNMKVRLHRAKNLLKASLFDITATASVFEFGNEKCDKIVNLVMRCI